MSENFEAEITEVAEGDIDHAGAEGGDQLTECSLSVSGYSAYGTASTQAPPQIVITIQQMAGLENEVKMEAINLYYQMRERLSLGGSSGAGGAKVKSVKGKRQLKIIFYCIFIAYAKLGNYVDAQHVCKLIGMDPSEVRGALTDYTPPGVTSIDPEKCVKYYIQRLNALLREKAQNFRIGPGAPAPLGTPTTPSSIQTPNTLRTQSQQDQYRVPQSPRSGEVYPIYQMNQQSVPQSPRSVGESERGAPQRGSVGSGWAPQYDVEEVVRGVGVVLGVCRKSEAGSLWISNTGSKTVAVAALYFYLNDIRSTGICKHSEVFGLACYMSFAGIRKYHKAITEHYNAPEDVVSEASPEDCGADPLLPQLLALYN